jgi:FlaA1/EpsC-like NDP-sugar epimerase
MPRNHLHVEKREIFADKHLLITGGTGSLAKVLLQRLLGGTVGRPARIVIFSRDEGKQHQMRLDLQHLRTATDEIVYRKSDQNLEFRIGDIRDFDAVAAALRGIDIVFHTAALKQVPTCEYFPYEAVLTNIGGAEKLVRAIRDLRLPVETVVGISTDKAVKPINTMGMTKAVQERIFASGGRDVPSTRFILVRYGNVLASRGSVIPLFHEQISRGGPLTITDLNMTRFLLSLEDAVDLIIKAVSQARSAETYVPVLPSARIMDVAKAMINGRKIDTVITGVRPGEKIHEVLISEEESYRTTISGSYYVIHPILPEQRGDNAQGKLLNKEYSSADVVMPLKEVRDLLMRQGLIKTTVASPGQAELLR